jgi:hypothetical protein
MDEDLELECYDIDQDDETIDVFLKCRSMETLGAQAMAAHRAGAYKTFARREEIPAAVAEFVAAEREGGGSRTTEAILLPNIALSLLSATPHRIMVRSHPQTSYRKRMNPSFRTRAKQP